MRPVNFNWWDRLLIGVAPGWGLNRAKNRAKASIAMRGFEAAGTGRRTTGWNRESTDANAVNAPSIAKLRELSRDLRRNNGWAKRGIQVISANTVGWGISARASGKDKGASARAQAVWKAWAETTECDYDGRVPFTGLQRLVMDTIVESGEALILKEAANSTDDLSVPIRVRVLEPDYLDVSRNGEVAGGGQIIQGIELDGRGRRVAYWIYEQHPGSMGGYGSYAKSFTSNRVQAKDVIHVYQVDRPGQMRGVPWLTSAIAKLNDFDDYDDAKLMQAKVAALFGAFVTDPQGDPSALGEEDSDDETLETLEPGQIEYLPPGREITFPNPPGTGDHGGFSETQLRRIAASLGVTYEDLTMDYSKVNFSSARMARLSHWQNIHDWRWNMLIPQFCEGVWGWVMGMAAELEGWEETPRAQWAPPPMPMLSPEKEGLAYQRLIRTGAMTLPQVIRELGEDFDSHMAEYAESNALLDSLGIVLDSDARNTSAAGMVQPIGSTAADEATDDE